MSICAYCPKLSFRNLAGNQLCESHGKCKFCNDDAWHQVLRCNTLIPLCHTHYPLYDNTHYLHPGPFIDGKFNIYWFFSELMECYGEEVQFSIYPWHNPDEPPSEQESIEYGFKHYCGNMDYIVNNYIKWKVFDIRRKIDKDEDFGRWGSITGFLRSKTEQYARANSWVKLVCVNEMEEE